MARRLLLLLLLAAVSVGVRAQWNSVPPDAVGLDWRRSVPEPVFGDSSLVRLYYKAWEIAAGRVRRGPEGLAASPYLDENCYDDQIWIWDGCFMLLFSKYAPDSFPGCSSLMNYYAPIHDGAASPLRIHLRDNPPLFAWVEHEYQRFTGVPARLDYIKRHYDYFNSLERGQRDENVSPNPIFLKVYRDSLGRADGYGWNGNGSGMDNTPRGRGSGGWDGIRWVDAICQQALAAERIAALEGDTVREEYGRLRDIVNRDYWDEQEGFYFDIDTVSGEPCRVMTLASVWAMMAGIPDSVRAARMVEKIASPKFFGGKRPWNSVSRSDADFDSVTGNYWRGGIWLPMAYMGTKALERYGYYGLADSLARNVVELQARVFDNYEPRTIWETYSPVADEPSTEHGSIVRQEFCGWSALGPVSLFIENVIGIRSADAAEGSIRWDIDARNGTHGLRRLRFGPYEVSLLFRDSERMVDVTANRPVTLIINGRRLDVAAGSSSFCVNN